MAAETDVNVQAKRVVRGLGGLGSAVETVEMEGGIEAWSRIVATSCASDSAGRTTDGRKGRLATETHLVAKVVGWADRGSRGTNNEDLRGEFLVVKLLDSQNQTVTQILSSTFEK